MKQETTEPKPIDIYGISDIATMAYDASLMLPYYISKSPLIEYTYIYEDGSEKLIFVKDESVQPGNSFKDRGSAYAIGRYVMKGVDSVITASAGNHGLGVARAAQYYNIESTVVIPENSEQVKKDLIRELGAKVIEISGDFSDAEFLAKSIANEGKSKLIHPFADPYVAAGQGSIAVELLDQLSGNIRSFIPVGGGGLLLGFGSVMKSYSKLNEIISCQPNSANTFTKSYVNGSITPSRDVDMEFGGLAVRTLDPQTYSLGSVVNDRCKILKPLQVFRAIHDWRILTGTFLEPAAAVGLAACLLSNNDARSDYAEVAIVTGSNSSNEIRKKVDRLAIENRW